mmetsp:Transcript_10127/g.26875  ORF Transcript_10127/g.26875 Transcript_10127/m.26875 type:complete len:89 (-) Transcript_10127:177-443(-)
MRFAREPTNSRLPICLVRRRFQALVVATCHAGVSTSTFFDDANVLTTPGMLRGRGAKAAAVSAAARSARTRRMLHAVRSRVAKDARRP